jgi:hypothetical protein
MSDLTKQFQNAGLSKKELEKLILNKDVCTSIPVVSDHTRKAFGILEDYWQSFDESSV